MAIDPSILLIGEMPGNLWALLVKLAISLFEILPMGLYKTILLRVYKARLKKEFPKGVHIDLTGNIGMRVQGIGQDVEQTAVIINIHIQNGYAATDSFFLVQNAIVAADSFFLGL
jgi:hypothetical protein